MDKHYCFIPWNSHGTWYAPFVSWSLNRASSLACPYTDSRIIITVPSSSGNFQMLDKGSYIGKCLVNLKEGPVKNTDGFMTLDYFQCNICNESRSIQHMGEIVSNPVCKWCHKPMRKINIRQTTLFNENQHRKVKSPKAKNPKTK